MEKKNQYFTAAFMMNCHLNSFQIKSHKQRLVQGAPLNFKNNVPCLLEYLEVCLGSEYQREILFTDLHMTACGFHLLGESELSC